MSLNEIQEIIKLEEQKQKLENELNNINKKINSKQESCAHNIVVNLGGFAQGNRIYNNPNYKFGPCKCLFCGMGDIYQRTDMIVEASGYLSQYDATTASGSSKKFEMIRIIALGLMEEKINIKNEELIYELNEIIKKESKPKEIIKIKVKKM